MPHPSEDLLELYALKRTSEPETVEVEEHLLICERCRTRLCELDQFLAAAKAAMATLSKPPVSVVSPSQRTLRRFGSARHR